MDVTKQQAFDAAWIGLKAQGFHKALMPHQSDSIEWDDLPGCAPHDEIRNRYCALGHVEKTTTRWGASHANDFNNELMWCHNKASSPQDMERRLHDLAHAHGLTIPGDDDGFNDFMAKVRAPVLLGVAVPY